MRLSAPWKAFLLTLAVAAACGKEENPAGVAAESSTLGPACTEGNLVWSDPGSTTAKCSGPWLYYTLTSVPWIGCSASSYPSGKCCNHAHVRGTRTVTVAVTPRKYTVQECCDPQEWCKPPCINITAYDYATPCANAAAAEKSRYPNSNLDLRTPITSTYQVTYATYGGPGTCTITLTNAPLSWHNAVDATQCSASPVTCTDYERPVLASCQSTQKTVCGPSASDPYILSCSDVANPISAVKYSAPNLSRAELAAVPDSYRGNDPTYQPVCLTDENMPLATADATAAAREKFDRLQGRLGNAAALTKDPNLDKKLVAQTKLLLELRGDRLTQPQRDDAAGYYQSHPAVLPACGTAWDAPAIPGATVANWTFEGPSPLAGWTLSSYGSVSRASDAHGGSSSVNVSAAWLKRQFTVPSDGGQLSLWYREYCDPEYEDVGALVRDLNTGGSSVVFHTNCNSSGTPWTRVLYSLAPHAGHRVELQLYANGYEGGSGLFDDVTYPYVPIELGGGLQLCHRMEEPHVSAEVVEIADKPSRISLAQRCADAVGTAGQLPADYPQRASFVDEARTSSVNVLTKAFKVVPGADAAARKPNLQRHLWTLGRWFEGARSGVYADDASGTATEKLWKDASDLAGALSKGVHQPAYDAFKQTFDVGALRSQSLASDREILDAFLSDFVAPGETAGRAPLKAPGLLVFTDALQPVLERLGLIAPYHDLACRFLDCAGIGRVTETSSLHRISGALADKAALTTELDAATAAYNSNSSYFSPNWTTYKSAFTQIRDRHLAIEDAVRDAYGTTDPYDPKMVLDINDSAPPPVLAFGRLVRDAAKKGQNYKATGLLLKDGAKSLDSGLLAENLIEIQGALTAQEISLHLAIGDYNGARSTAIAALINEIDWGTQNNDVEARKAALLARARDLALDLAGLRLSASVDAVRFADQNAQMKKVLDALAAQGDVYVTPKSFGPYQFVGLDGNGPSTPFTDVKQVATRRFGADGLITTGQPGEILNITVDGAYQPTCSLTALNLSYYGAPVNPTAIDQRGDSQSLNDASTLSMGYRFQFVNDSFQARSSTFAYEHVVTFDPACQGSYSASFLGIGASANICDGESQSISFRQDLRWGDETRLSAAFSLGLRLKGNPFDGYPTGALLAVLVKPGSTNRRDILDVQVVEQPRHTIVFDKAADLYFVVNDIECSTAATSELLTVNAVKLQPAKAAMLQLASAIDAVRTHLREPEPPATTSIADSIMAQGRLLPDQMAALRTDAREKLEQACGCNVSTYPSVIQGFFETWVDQEILHIEREVAIVSILREMNVVLLEAKALERDLEMLGRKGRLAGLLPRWTLQNLDLANEAVTLATENMRMVVAERVHPMAYLRYPETFVGLSQPQKLLGLDWVYEPLGDTYDQASLAGKVLLATTEIKNKLQTAVSNSTDPLATDGKVTQAYAVLRFPNPYNPPTEIPPLRPGKEADPSRTLRVWDPIRKYFESGCTDPITYGYDPGCDIRFEVRPEDFYEYGGGNAVLGCGLVSPVIKRMAFYLVDGQDIAGAVYNAQDIRKDTRVSRLMEFPLTTGVETFDFENEDYLTTPRTKVIYGMESAWKTRFDALSEIDVSESVRGVSPFASFTVHSLGVYGDPWWGGPDSTQDFGVIMLIEARQKAPGVDGVLTCPCINSCPQ